jgi:SAM-dependent methyltransferase
VTQGESMNYILKDSSEPQRLDEQSLAEEFSLKNELCLLDFGRLKKVLDAGCGSGVLCRYLEENNPSLNLFGCDISEDSLKYCRTKGSGKTQYFRHNFVEAPVDNKFDLIVSRLVFHHLSLDQQKSAIKNLKSSLPGGGSLCLIDIDGLFLNLGTSSEILLPMIETVRGRFGGHLTSARYFPALMKEAGFSKIHYEIKTMDFQGKAREREVEQWRQRFESSFAFYLDVFGSELEARRFLKLYLEEARRPETTMFYNKFIVTGTREDTI